MGKVNIQEFQGKKIIYMSFSNLKKEEDILEVIEEAKPIIRSSPAKSVYAISDLRVCILIVK